MISLSGKVLVSQQPGALQDDVEGAFQVAVENFVLGQIAILEIDRIALGDGLFPYAAERVMARIGERQHFESLCREHARQPGPPVGRQIHDLFAAGAAVKENKSPTRIGFFFRRV